MKTLEPIHIVVHRPKTEEGWRELRRRMAIVHANAVLNGISKLDCPTSQKEELLEATVNDAMERIKAEKQQRNQDEAAKSN